MELESVVVRYGADITDFETKTQNMLASLTRGATVAEAKAKAIEDSIAGAAGRRRDGCFGCCCGRNGAANTFYDNGDRWGSFCRISSAANISGH